MIAHDIEKKARQDIGFREVGARMPLARPPSSSARCFCGSHGCAPRFQWAPARTDSSASSSRRRSCGAARLMTIDIPTEVPGRRFEYDIRAGRAHHGHMVGEAVPRDVGQEGPEPRYPTDRDAAVHGKWIARELPLTHIPMEGACPSSVSMRKNVMGPGATVPFMAPKHFRDPGIRPGCPARKSRSPIP